MSYKVIDDSQLRFKRCCCFSLKTGTTILGAMTAIGSISAIWCILVLLHADSGRYRMTDVFLEQLVKSIPFYLSPTIVGLLCTLYVVLLLASAFMMYGNSRDKTQVMLPYVWVYSCTVGLFCGAYIQRMVVHFVNGNPLGGVDALWRIFATAIAGLLVVQVVRCRIMEIAEPTRQTIPFTQVQQSAPPVYQDEPRSRPVE